MGLEKIVRILCSLSASFINITRISFAIAKYMRRKFSAASSSLELNVYFASFVTPITSVVISSPKREYNSLSVADVSSIVSCNMAAPTASESSPKSSKISATATG